MKTSVSPAYVPLKFPVFRIYPGSPVKIVAAPPCRFSISGCAVILAELAVEVTAYNPT
jgi:hypothetical protein